MSNFKFEIDASSIASIGGEINQVMQETVDLAVKSLAASCYGKVVELAQENLHSSLNKYLDALSFKEAGKGIWIISLDKSAMWIEEGKSAGEMIDDLLKNGAKMSKSGHRYKVIPFSHFDIPQNMTPKAMGFRDILKAELKARGIPFKKLETDSFGKPKLGLLHSLDIDSPRPSAAADYPVFSGLNIAQNKGADGNIRRTATTFRVVSDSQKGSGKWLHPGVEAKHFFDKAFEEARNSWENEILPDLLGSK